MNFNSLQTTEKIARLQAQIDTENPDIIIGSETKLDKSFSSQIFPDRYHGQIFRRDHRKGSGGVVIAVKNELLASEVKSRDSEAEIVWAKIHLRKPLYIGSYYRNPSTSESSQTALRRSIEDVLTASLATPNVILGGDFNLPDIDWTKTEVKPNSQYPIVYSTIMLEIWEDSSLSQHVEEPTHLRGNTLDLVITSNKDQVENIEVIPGMSDHHGITFNVKTEVNRNKKKPRKVYLYKKANEAGLREELIDLNSKFFRMAINKSIEGNWNLFKFGILDAINKHIPTKILGTKQDVACG